MDRLTDEQAKSQSVRLCGSCVRQDGISQVRIPSTDLSGKKERMDSCTKPTPCLFFPPLRISKSARIARFLRDLPYTIPCYSNNPPAHPTLPAPSRRSHHIQ